MDLKSKSIGLKTILAIIAIGIWAIVLQNAGVIPTKQNVYVKGGSIDVDNTVRVKGSVDVDNTVSISIDEVLGRDGKKYYYSRY